MYHQLTGFVKYIARSKLWPHCITPNISILVCFSTNMFDLVNNVLQATHRRNSIVVETVSNNNNIIISKIVIWTFSIATRGKYPKTLISEICTCMTSCWSFYKFLQNLHEPSRFKKRSLDFMTWIYLTSFDKDVLFQCFFDAIFKHFGCVFESKIYFRLSNFLFNYLPTIKRYIIKVFFKRTLGIFTATISKRWRI